MREILKRLIMRIQRTLFFLIINLNECTYFANLPIIRLRSEGAIAFFLPYQSSFINLQ